MLKAVNYSQLNSNLIKWPPDATSKNTKLTKVTAVEVKWQGQIQTKSTDFLTRWQRGTHCYQVTSNSGQ